MSKLFFSFHGYIIACMQALGYDVDEGGVCNGVALSGIVAFFSNQYTEFANLVAELEDYRTRNPSGFLQELQGLRLKILANRSNKEVLPFSEAENRLVPLRILCENIQFLAEPDLYREWFPDNQHVNQTDGETLAGVLIPNRQIKQFSGYVGIYQKEEFQNYFSKFMALAGEAKVDFALQISSPKHTMGLLYSTHLNQWCLINAEYNSPISLTSAKDITRSLFRGFREPDTLGIVTKIYSRKTDEAALLVMLEQLTSSIPFKRAHELTFERVQYATSSGATLVYLAAAEGYCDTLRLLHDADANVNKADNRGITPAQIASQNKHISAIHLLHTYGADLNQADSNGITIALFAAIVNDPLLIYLLHECDADLNKATFQGGTPAMIAAENGHVDVICALHAAKADLNKADNRGNTPAIMAAIMGKPDVIRALQVASADLNKTNKFGSTPAIIAASNGHADVIRALHQCGADLNKANNKGQTPAYCAAFSGSVAVLKELAASGVDLTETILGKGQSQSLLDVARRRKHATAAYFLANLSPKGVSQHGWVSPFREVTEQEETRNQHAFFSPPKSHFSEISSGSITINKKSRPLNFNMDG